MEFAKKVGRKWITARLMARGIPQPDAERSADAVIDFLSNVEEHITHGRLIMAGELKRNCEPTLQVEELEEINPLWQKIWQLYVRYEVFFMLPNPMGVMGGKGVVIETSDVTFAINS